MTLVLREVGERDVAAIAAIYADEVRERVNTYEYDVPDAAEMLRRMRSLHDAGVQVIVLLALSDEGAPAYDHSNAAALGDLGIPAFACTPDSFPDMLAVALTGGDIGAWAEREQRNRQ